MARNERAVEFAVRARDEYSKVLKNLEKQQEKISAAARAADRRSLVGTAKSEIDAAVADYKRLASEVERYRAVQSNAAKTGKLSAAEMRELGDTIKLVRDRARDAMGVIDKKRAALTALVGQARGGYAAFDRLAVSMQQGATGAQQQASAVANDAAQLKKLETASQKAGTAQSGLKTRIDATTDAMQRQNGRGTKGARGDAQDVEIFGLKPWQLTNLGYQVNDVISGLAMGQAPLQVFAQQAGQFAQIWPNVMVSLARSIPIVAATTAVLAPFIAAGMRMASVAESARIFTAELALSADGARYNVEQLVAITEQMEKFGIATDKSREIVRAFVRAGLDAKDFARFAEVAQILSNATGNSVVEEAERISKAFSGNVDDVRKLDEELNFLTASQLAQVRAMEASGDRAGAMALAFDILNAKVRGTVGEMSAWDRATTSLSRSWDKLVSAIQKTGVIELLGREAAAIGRDVEKTAEDFENWIDVIQRLSRVDISALSARIKELADFIETESRLGNGDSLAVDTAREKLRELQNIVAARQEELNLIKEAGEAEAEANEQSEASAKIVQEALEKQLAALRKEASAVELTNRERFIEEQLLETRNKLLEDARRLNQEFLGLTEAQTAELRRQAGITFDNNWIKGGGLADFSKRVTGVESGGDPKAKATMSSATGLGQFIEDTWLRMFEQYFPDRAAGMTREAILLLREDADISTAMVELYAKENAALLQKAGVAVTEANLYLAHFLGPSGAIAVLTAKANEPVENLLSSGTLNANPFLKGMTAGDLQGWAAKKMGGSDAELAVSKQLSEIDQKRLETQKEYLADYQQRIDQQKFELDNALKAGREAYVANALREEELKAKKAGVQLTQEQIDKVRELAAAEYDRKNVDKEINDLMAQRALLFESLKLAQASGDMAATTNIVGEIDAINLKLNEAIDKAIAFWQALGGPGAEAAILKLQNAKLAIANFATEARTKFLPTAEQINESLAEIGANAFKAFAQALVEGKNAAEAFFNALLQGIGEFLIEIGKAIIKQMLFNIISGGSNGGGMGGGIFGWINGLFKHDGGMISDGGKVKAVNPAVFANAKRFHNGGVVGLGPREVPIIALEDEEVLTRDDPRHVMNGGAAGAGGGNGATNIKNVNVFDPSDVLEAALSSVVGERLIMNFMTRNATKINGALSR